MDKFKFTLKSGIKGEAEKIGGNYKVAFSNGVTTRVTEEIATKYLSNGVWKKQ